MQITGNNKNNILFGTNNSDAILGLNGNDMLFGFGGNDQLSGGKGDDQLDGGIGSDTMAGGKGNDVYIVDSVNDDIIEMGGQGTDSVLASIDYTLGNNVENLTLIGSADRGIGNDLDNVITGNNRSNTLEGGAGNDILTGGVSTDRFRYDTGSTYARRDLGFDLITDFVAGSDKIVLDKTTFSQLNSAAGNGFSIAAEFAVVGSNAAAKNSSAFITYNQTNGMLFYNANGAAGGFGAGGPFVLLAGTPGLTANDFTIEA